MNKALRDEVMRLPPEERVELAQEIWNSLDGVPQPTEAQVAEAERRFDAYRKNPERAVPWKDALDRVRARLR